MSNRLAFEKSPYLRQHADNPVDWHPWGEEAFALARAQDRPIFLSIGYSTCHWCHVMERECFTDPDIARLMNETCVNVKVDREERPDVDRVYMGYVQALTGGGGWPMSVWLTPSLEPFFGGTYFPPADHDGGPGFPSLLRRIAAHWEERRDELRESGGRAIAALRRDLAAEPPVMLGAEPLRAAYRAFAASFDPTVPGFGPAPRFPRPMVHYLLLRQFARTGDPEAAKMVVATLGTMAGRGIHDQLGGGFHRYATDRRWHVPHFEKMLYDQALMAMACVEAYQVWPDAEVARVVRGTLDYLLRDLAHADGGFYAAEDADSLPSTADDEPREGAFYVFTAAEVREALGEPAAAIFSYRFGVEEDGNWEGPEGAGRNILHRRRGIAETAHAHGLSPEEAGALLEASREKLRLFRDRRPRPRRDEKIVCAWNGLAISALARASQVLGERRFLEAAERCAGFVLGHLVGADGALRRRWCDGEAAVPAFLDDHACLAQGLLDLYEASFDPAWLLRARDLAATMVRRFHDEADGGFFCTDGSDASVLLRGKDEHDGAEPSGNAIAALVLTRLGHLLDRGDWLGLARGTVRCFSARIAAAPQAVPQLIVAHDLLLDPPLQVVIAGERDAPDTTALLAALHRRLAPRKQVLLADARNREALGEQVPLLRGKLPVDGRAAAYLCSDGTCRPPTTSPAELAELVGGRALGAPR